MNVTFVAQGGRIGYQALLCAASIRNFHPASDVRIFVCIPKNTKKWKTDPSVTDSDVLAGFDRYGCNVVTIDNTQWGSKYPHANKFYSILALPPDEPFVFLDSDTVLVSELSDAALNLHHPALKPGGFSWPQMTADRSIGETWRQLYRFYGLDPEPFHDPERPDTHHRCYPYYNAGVVYFEQAGAFANRWIGMARELALKKPPLMEGQEMFPFLDQITLPVALASFGVPRAETCDEIHDLVVHYHSPFFLQVRHPEAAVVFEELKKDEPLVSALQHDEAFRYYMSDEARRIVAEVHAEVWCEGGARNYKAFKKALRQRVPIMR